MGWRRFGKISGSSSRRMALTRWWCFGRPTRNASPRWRLASTTRRTTYWRPSLAVKRRYGVLIFVALILKFERNFALFVYLFSSVLLLNANGRCELHYYSCPLGDTARAKKRYGRLTVLYRGAVHGPLYSIFLPH